MTRKQAGTSENPNMEWPRPAADNKRSIQPGAPFSEVAAEQPKLPQPRCQP
jgi:hypothetical protein